MNGLMERAFTFPMRTTDDPSQFMASGTRTVSTGVNPSTKPPYPNATGKLWLNTGASTTRLLTQFLTENAAEGFRSLGIAEVDFVKRWRGITRTSIVDVADELEIEIPPFDSNDFYYIDENGQRVLMSANHRIDLVFIYSKPIDMSGTTISRFTGNTPATITAPTLGIVKGAGLGVSFKTTQGGLIQPDDNINLNNVDGIPLIVPHVADENVANTGIAGIKGSFPSPDDLMNMTPLISENLSEGHLALVGQSILPVAYVVVRATAATNTSGVAVVAVDDLIDIRPFFRTTELSYNERAGIAAATPQLSLANPVASEGYVEMHTKDIFNDYTAKINQLRAELNTAPASPKLVGCGYVKGGFFFGVEGALADLMRQRYNLTGDERLKQEIQTRYGYPVIPDYPDWDISEWCSRGTFASKGAFPNDYINFHTLGLRIVGAPVLPFAAYSNAALSTRISALGTDKVVPPPGIALQQEQSCIYFVKKRIQIDRSNIQWASDYHVDAQLWNCIPLSCRAHADGNNRTAAGAASIWIDKRPDEFTIYVSWVAADQYNAGKVVGMTEPGNSNVYPHEARDIGSQFAGFSVINNDFVGGSYIHQVVDGESAAGVAIYPTVSFQVYGIPNGYSGNGSNLHGLAPVLSLS